MVLGGKKVEEDLAYVGDADGAETVVSVQLASTGEVVGVNLALAQLPAQMRVGGEVTSGAPPTAAEPETPRAKDAAWDY
ncbi:MAG: hypothetical protein IPO43_12885 [Rhodoferax sp.]|nr:hypothetical protein [Rhodoferax sp.]